MDVQISEDNGARRVESSAVGQVSTSEADRTQEPYDGMTFDSEEAVRAYYDEYAGRAGFITRVLSSRKSERDGSIISRGLGCRGVPDNQRSGSFTNQKRDRRRDGCTAMILVKREKPGMWVVRKFVRDHNHPLVISPSKRRPTFDEKDKRIQELTAELRIKKRLSAAYREQLLSLMKDVDSHSEHMCTKVQAVRRILKELEAKRKELSNHSRHHK
ncbi:PREDICTED: protein FAR1-RELATED SEQUENCE 2-like [Nicotiana attenuata]|uniref:Protein far1-related sequence 5 n=1 Tax=Nicotiana attenuata TaxID=49451 RepID=A0A314KQT9_NICAT|nr:PREDICTED: protein FAR1-RELATED SEQUENCE 2-like [Nicotiana attenuata]XP_019226848.1 PREDICTED: protein FAR1-RELATED SEQUENCE 2-like [Nicotiana attenuata]XP_019226849.1 PREDICTED: protein FAR1-RELATED SEQUENCE 2-like [Nicotiana attenuata]OIT31791.1 protein far1-related sequence 5 [Nicotiana attenuata]